jgi:hypothetical protein
MKKLLGKTLLYLSVLLLIPYAYFTWQAKQGVDTFMLSHNLGDKLNYEWLLINFTGKVVLLDIKIGAPREEPIFTAERLYISTESVFDLLGARDKIIYNEYPTNLSVSLVDASTLVPEQLAQMFGVGYQKDYLDFLYPQECGYKIDKNLAPLKFNGKARFTIHRTADISEVEFKFSSLSFANFKGSLKINNYSESSSNGRFISDFSAAFSDIALLQINTQKCLATLGKDKQKFIDGVVAQLEEKATTHQLALEQGVSESVAQFMFVPQEIEIAFDIEAGKKFSQIPFDPFYQVPEKLGLSLKLNGKPLNAIFDQLASESLSQLQEKDSLDNTTQQNETISTTKPVEYRTLEKYQLKQHIGAKVALDLRNGKRVEGYVQSVEASSLILLQRKFKGKTVAPFAYKDILKITLINSEK